MGVGNQIDNAHHAMRGREAPRRISLATRLDRARQRLQLAVTDTGPGIPQELGEKIIEDHGGTIDIQSEQGRGATFLIELPLPERKVVGITAQSVDALPPVSAKRV